MEQTVINELLNAGCLYTPLPLYSSFFCYVKRGVIFAQLVFWFSGTFQRENSKAKTKTSFRFLCAKQIHLFLSCCSLVTASYCGSKGNIDDSPAG